MEAAEAVETAEAVEVAEEAGVGEVSGVPTIHRHGQVMAVTAGMEADTEGMREGASGLPALLGGKATGATGATGRGRRGRRGAAIGENGMGAGMGVGMTTETTNEASVGGAVNGGRTAAIEVIRGIGAGGKGVVVVAATRRGEMGEMGAAANPRPTRRDVRWSGRRTAAARGVATPLVMPSAAVAVGVVHPPWIAIGATTVERMGRVVIGGRRRVLAGAVVGAGAGMGVKEGAKAGRAEEGRISQGGHVNALSLDRGAMGHGKGRSTPPPPPPPLPPMAVVTVMTALTGAFGATEETGETRGTGGGGVTAEDEGRVRTTTAGTPVDTTAGTTAGMTTMVPIGGAIY